VSDTVADAKLMAATYKSEEETHSHEYDSGLLVMPVASRTPGHRVVRTHGGISLRRVKFHLLRSDRPPVIPQPSTQCDTLLTARVVPYRPLADGANGALVFRVAGEYLFVAEAPRVPGVNSLPTGASPYPLGPSDLAAQNLFAGAQAPDTITTVAGYDAVVSDLLAKAVANAGKLGYSWPLTVYPAAYSLPTLEG